MIPLKIHRLLLVLFSVSGTLVFADRVFRRVGIESQIAEGLFAGVMVFLLAYVGGYVLVFCGKGLVDDPERRAKIRSALLEIGVIEERRRGDRRRARPAQTGDQGEKRRNRDRRQEAPAPRQLMYVSVVDSDSFIAITVNAGRTHRAFVSTRMVDAFSPEALRGVLAHEYGHVDNGHPIRQAVTLGLVAAVKMSVGIPLGVAIVVLLSYLYMLRQWEFQADAAAVERSSSADVLNAFKEYLQIEGEKEISWISEIFCAHPSVHRRVEALTGL